jgi:hypothetical protein
MRNDIPVRKFKVNDWQRVIARSYGGGDYAYLADIDDYAQLRQELSECGDTLFAFLMIELSEAEDCENLDTAMQRIDTAINDLGQVFDVLREMARKAA